MSGNPSAVTHAYAEGSYSISATASDDDGTYNAGNTISVAVSSVPPTLTLSGPAAVNELATYTLSLSAVEPSQDAITSWSVNWGDGTTQVVGGNPSSVNHTYAEGNYTISATASDDDGTYNAGNTIGLTVNSVSPTIILTGAAAVNELSAYTLSLSAIQPSQDAITSWSINWGDGSTQTVSGNPSAVTHAYAEGNYTISATASDDDGTYNAGNTITVAVSSVPPTLTLSGPAAVNELATYTLSLSALEPSQDAITSWTINWGDGATQAVNGNPSTVTHTYAEGNYLINAKATDEDGTYSAANTVPVTVNSVPPTLTLGGLATVNEGAVYTLSLSASELSQDTISSWTITWGDGATQVVSGNAASVAHTYLSGLNTYKIHATATDEDGTYTAGNIVTVTVGHAAASHYLVSGASSTTAGAAYTLTVTALDPYNNVVPGYGGTIHFTSTDGQAVLPGDYRFTGADGGSHTFSFTLKTSGTQALVATDTVIPALTGTQRNITVVPATPATFTFAGFPTTTTAGTSQNFTLTVRDAYGNIATGYTGKVHFTSSDRQASLPADYTFTATDAGVHTFSATLKTAGMQSARRYGHRVGVRDR